MKEFQVYFKPGKGRAESAEREAKGMQPFSPRFASVDQANAHMAQMRRAPRFKVGRTEVRRVK